MNSARPGRDDARSIPRSIETLLGGAVRGAGRFRIRRDLRDVHMLAAASAIGPDTPVLYVSNHATWWDGFLIQRLHETWRQGPLTTVVAERHLRRHPALRAAGCIGIEQGSPTSLRSMLRSVASRSAVEGMGLSLFPQGSIQSSRRRPLGFEGGVNLIARAMGAPVVVPVAIHAEMLNHRKPTVFVLAGAPYAWRPSDGADVVEGRVARLLDVVQDDVDERGEDAPIEWKVRMQSASGGAKKAERLLVPTTMRIEEARA